MNEKRKFPRRVCNLKVNFTCYEGDPDTVDAATGKPVSGKGLIRDMSRGGVFISSDARVSVNLPIDVSFVIENQKYDVPGSIVRTGLIKNNPSEVAQRFASEKIREDAYIAVQFNEPLETVPV